MPHPQIGYSKTNLVEVEFDKPKKSFIFKVEVLGKIVRLLRDKQNELYPRTGGGQWVSRYFFEVLNTDRPLEDLKQYIKSGSKR